MTAYSGVSGRALNAIDSDLGLSHQVLKPLWSVENLEVDSEGLEKWCKQTIEACESYYADYFQIQLDNILLDRGIQWLTQERYANFYTDRQLLNNRRGPRVVFNHLMDAREYFVSKLVRYPPAVNVYPSAPSAEAGERAKTCKDVLGNIWYQNKIDESNATLIRHTKVMGEAFRFIEFNPNAGDTHPDYLAASLRGDRIPILDSSGKPVLTATGEPLMIQKTVKIGEVQHNVYPGYHVYEMPCSRREDIDYAWRWKTVHVETLKAQYPDYADKIKADGGFDVFDNYKVNLGKAKDEVVVYECWHRSTEFLERGRYIKYLKGCNTVLESTFLASSDGKLPYIYLSDMEVPNQIRGMSFIQQVFPIQHQINAIASLIYKSFVLLAHPKYVMREGSCDVQQLLNESTIVQYSDEPPQLMVNSVVPNEMFGYLNKLEEIFNKLSGQFTLSTGQAPSGVRAAKALRLIEEQEDKRAYSMATKYNNVAIVEDAKMSLVRAADNYKDDDGRLLKILGKNNEWRLRKFKVADIAGPYEVRIENTTAISQSPAGRLEDMIEIANVRLPPDSPLSTPQFLKLTQIGALDEMQDITTRSYQCAKSENDDMRSGETVKDPETYEDLIVHWMTHAQDMQGRDFKDYLTPERQALFERHLQITEYLMWKKAFGLKDPLGNFIDLPNPVFQQNIMMKCPQWPLIFKIPSSEMIPLGGMPPQATPPAGGPPGHDVPPAGPSEAGPLQAKDPQTPPPNIQQGPIQ